MDKLMGILLEINPDIDYKKETALIDAGLLDSFDIVTLVSEIDDVFGVEIPAQALPPENFNSAKALYGLIRRLQEC